jgi:putative oxidoreductase
MKKISCIAAVLLGLAFVFFGLNFFAHFVVVPSPQAGTPAAAFLGAMYGSGYLTLVKVLEIVGGVLLILPRTRVWGLILVGAILFNIAAVHQFFLGGLKDPTVIGLIVLALIVTWSRRCALCCVNSCGCSSGCGCGTSGGCGCGSSDKPASTGGCCGGK